MTKKELKELLKEDKANYLDKKVIKRLFDMITYQNNYRIYKQLVAARNYLFYRNNKKTIINKLKFLYYSRKNNKLGIKNNIELNCTIGKNLKIYHGGVITTKNAILGDGIIIHGSNCIGIRGKDLDAAPTIGNNVEIGYGSIIFGGIKIADDIIIGANSVVNKDFLEKGIVIAGNPAKRIK